MKLAICAAISVLTAVPAHAVVLECDIVQRTSAWGWFAPTIRFDYDEGSDTATVMDAVIAEKRGKPVAAEINDNTKARTTFVWTVVARSADKSVAAEDSVNNGA